MGLGVNIVGMGRYLTYAKTVPGRGCTQRGSGMGVSLLIRQGDGHGGRGLQAGCQDPDAMGPCGPGPRFIRNDTGAMTRV
jgi:hypothetical protein